MAATPAYPKAWTLEAAPEDLAEAEAEVVLEVEPAPVAVAATDEAPELVAAALEAPDAAALDAVLALPDDVAEVVEELEAPKRSAPPRTPPATSLGALLLEVFSAADE